MDVIAPSSFDFETGTENPAFLREQLITCIGNKRALLPEIGAAIDDVRTTLGRERISFLDLFAGSGVVSRRAKQAASRIVSNDLERYSETVNKCYLANADALLLRRLNDDLQGLNATIRKTWAPGFLTELYAPADDRDIRPGERVFYTRRNAVFLDTARRAIAALAADVQPYFLGPLLSAASVHANTAGVFKGFYKNAAGVGQYGGRGRHAMSRITGEIELKTPVFSNHACAVTVTRADANSLVRDIEPVDIAYVDPPYNQHPYGSNYFMLNLICDYQRPSAISRVSGIPSDWNRSGYNRAADAERLLFALIEDCNARFVLISYNSEGFIPRKRFLQGLRRLGQTRVRDVRYNTFRGSRNLHSREPHVTEHLFLLDKR